MLLVTLPPSGTGVTESLALDHAPLTRITPVGTLFSDCGFSEKSPPFLGGTGGFSAWLHTASDEPITITEHNKLERIMPPKSVQLSGTSDLFSARFTGRASFS